MDKQQQEKKVGEKRAKAQKMARLTAQAKLFGGGLVTGVVLTLVIGFSTDNLVTPSNAERMVRDAANEREIAVLVPYCVANFRESPDRVKNLAALKATSSWMRDQFIGKGGWSNTLAGDGANSAVSGACAAKLVADDAAATAASAKGT